MDQHRATEAMADGRVIAPREVDRELLAKDGDDVEIWASDHVFTEPIEAVQRGRGDLRPVRAAWPARWRGPIRDRRGPGPRFAVVTYEGRSFSGERTTRWDRKMPGICQHLGVPGVTLPEALERLGGRF
jgi:hypothetical protein